MPAYACLLGSKLHGVLRRLTNHMVKPPIFLRGSHLDTCVGLCSAPSGPSRKCTAPPRSPRSLANLHWRRSRATFAGGAHAKERRAFWVVVVFWQEPEFSCSSEGAFRRLGGEWPVCGAAAGGEPPLRKAGWEGPAGHQPCLLRKAECPAGERFCGASLSRRPGASALGVPPSSFPSRGTKRGGEAPPLCWGPDDR